MQMNLHVAFDASTSFQYLVKNEIGSEALSEFYFMFSFIFCFARW